MWIYVSIFFLESFTLYLTITLGPLEVRRAKVGHWGLGILLNLWARR